MKNFLYTLLGVLLGIASQHLISTKPAQTIAEELPVAPCYSVDSLHWYMNNALGLERINMDEPENQYRFKKPGSASFLSVQFPGRDEDSDAALYFIYNSAQPGEVVAGRTIRTALHNAALRGWISNL